MADENFSESSLISIGINTVGHRIKIFQACKKLQQRNSFSNRNLSSKTLQIDADISDFSHHHASLMIDFKDLEFTQKIGSGGAATVFKGLLKGKVEVAIKVLKDFDDSNTLTEFKKEIEVMR